MMHLVAIFLVSFTAALSGALMPGPLLTVTIAQTARRGFMASLLLVLGHSALELLLVIALLLGFGHVLGIPVVKGAVTLLGGGMLVWMGWGMIREARGGTVDLQVAAGDGGEPADGRATRSPLLTGALVSLSNPYWVIWWATIGLTFFAALSRNGLGGIAAFYIGHIAGDILWYVAVGVAVSTGRRLISPRVYGGILQVCGGFLIFLGGSFLYLLGSGRLWDIRMDMTGLQHRIGGVGKG